MKINITTTLIAIVYNVINLLIWQHILTMPNATSMIYIIIFPCYWIITIIIVTIITLKKKARWLQKSYRLSTFVALFFCTPVFFLVIRSVKNPTSYLASSGYITKGEYTIKYESWNYTTGGLQVVKYWKADKSNCEECDSSFFKRDSTWVYFKGKDTLRVDVYKNDKLISEKK